LKWKARKPVNSEECQFLILKRAEMKELKFDSACGLPLSFADLLTLVFNCHSQHQTYRR
jgi:hypothetical protein